MKYSDVVKAYKLAEETRMKLWQILYDPPLEILEEEVDEVSPDLIFTEVFDDYIKITVKDILPQSTDIDKSQLQFYWLGIMKNALKGTEILYEKVLCAICIYSPVGQKWDVDNRVYKFIIDGLRFMGLIRNDSWDRLSFMVIGNEDKINPRTEIYIIKHPENLYWFIPENSS